MMFASVAVLATLGLCSTDVASLPNHHPGFPCFLRAAAAAAPSAGAVAGVQCCHLPLFVYSLTPTLPNVLTTNTHGIRKHRTLRPLLFLP